MLLEEVLQFFDRPQTKTFIDATLGGGGHASALLEKIAGITLLIGFDQDEEAVARSGERLKPFSEKVKIVHASFFGIKGALEEMGVDRADAILIDLGVSSFQLDDANRGFSFAKKGPLDMRMDQTSPLTAEIIVNTYPEKELALLIKKYGEERHARRIAKAIVREREKTRINDTTTLAQIIEKAYPRKEAALSHIHPATRTFQAIRIAVNGEIDHLEEAIEQAATLLNPEGRIAVISFHSLEDRIVKQTFNKLAPHCVCPKKMPVCTCGKPGFMKVITKKPITPTEEEIAKNPRARSAKLRVAQKLSDTEEK